MPPKRRASLRSKPSSASSSSFATEQHLCRHDADHLDLLLEPSPHAAVVGYTQPPAAQRAKAQGTTSTTTTTTTKPHTSNNNSNSENNDPSTFPAPLVLPSDDLALDPKHPRQSVLAWTRLKERNAVTNARRTIYLVPPPASATKRVALMVAGWTKPDSSSSSGGVGGGRSKQKAGVPLSSSSAAAAVDVEGVAAYIRAFYHPLPVEVLPASTFTFTQWSDEEDGSVTMAEGREEKGEGGLIGLRTASEIIGIRTRVPPSFEDDTRSSSSGSSTATFPRQLNLDDLLDAAITSLPADAFAMMLLIEHDLYEDEDDVFVCGRAYGGSRVAVVSAARYGPGLDRGSGLDLQHVWPLSHCRSFVEGVCGSGDGKGKGKKQEKKDNGKGKKVVGGGGDDDVCMLDAEEDEESSKSNSNAHTIAASPLRAAVDAVVALRAASSDSTSYSLLSRMCRTVSHELGHCFGIDHCTYYACVMQGSASLLEDARQPLYLCPVDMVKVLKATGASEEEWMTAMLGFCERFAQDETFVALGAWLKTRRK